MVALTAGVAVVLAIGAALAAAGNQLCIRVGTQRGHAHHAVLVVMAVNLLVLVPLAAIVYYPSYGLTPRSAVSFAAAGVLGTLLGRLSLYTSIGRIGASRTAPIVSSNALVATVLGVAVLGETLTARHAAGVLLIVAGVAAIAWETSHENPDDLSRRELAVGLAIPLVGALAFGWEPIYASFGFAEGTPAPVGVVVKTAAAALGFTLYLRWRGALPGAGLLRTSDVRWFVLAGLANTAFLLGYYVALSVAPVGVVLPLINTQTMFVVVLSALVMPERLEVVTWKLVAGALAVVVGAVLVSVSV